MESETLGEGPDTGFIKPLGDSYTHATLRTLDPAPIFFSHAQVLRCCVFFGLLSISETCEGSLTEGTLVKTFDLVNYSIVFLT
jgi:hypothetical protein